jgi:hypothetical protein
VQYRERGHWRVADLVLERDRPILVVSWRSTGEARRPYVCFELDAERLELLEEAQALYRYHGTLEKPCNTSSVWALLHSRGSRR